MDKWRYRNYNTLGKMIDSPRFFYGSCTCPVCKIKISCRDGVWEKHVRTKEHRENLIKNNTVQMIPAPAGFDNFYVRFPQRVPKGLKPIASYKTICKRIIENNLEI